MEEMAQGALETDKTSLLPGAAGPFNTQMWTLKIGWKEAVVIEC